MLQLQIAGFAKSGEKEKWEQSGAENFRSQTLDLAKSGENAKRWIPVKKFLVCGYRTLQNLESDTPLRTNKIQLAHGELIVYSNWVQ